MKVGSTDGEEMARQVRRVREGRQRLREHGERSTARNLATVGVLGWLVVTPTLLGIFVGRWLDHMAASGIFWTGALLVAGMTLGCVLGWRWINRQ